MIKNKKYLIIILIIYLFTGCSFDSKTGIWSGDEKEKQKLAELEKEQNQKINVEKAYSSGNIYLREITAVKKVILNQPTKNLDWKMSGLNLQNFMGNIYLSSISNNFLKKKIGKNKFSNSKVMASPIVINNNILLTDDTGTIFYISRSGELHWKKNIYKKINKKISKNLSLSVYKNKIYIADNIGFIYSIDLNTSKLIWIKNHGIPIKSKIKVFDNKIFVINQDNRIICFETEKGSKIWDVRSVSSFIKSQGYLALAITKEGDLLTINSSGDLLKTYPPLGPLALKTKLFFFNLKNSCSKKDNDIPCLKEISVRLIGSLTLFFAKSAIAITAYLPLDVNFIMISTYFA